VVTINSTDRSTHPDPTRNTDTQASHRKGSNTHKEAIQARNSIMAVAMVMARTTRMPRSKQL